MPDPSFPEANPPDGGHSVIQSFLKVEENVRFTSPQPSVQESWPQLLNEHPVGVNSLLRPLTFHADPLAPLRRRDELALDEVFGESYGMDEILDDIYGRLEQLCPEPCWDDEPFDFLKGFL